MNIYKINNINWLPISVGVFTTIFFAFVLGVVIVSIVPIQNCTNKNCMSCCNITMETSANIEESVVADSIVLLEKQILELQDSTLSILNSKKATEHQSSNKKSLKPSLKKKIGYLPIDTMECSDTKVIIVKQVNIN